MGVVMADTGHATTVIPIDFKQLAAASELAVEATVVDLQSVSVGQPIPPTSEVKDARIPEGADEDSKNDGTEEATASGESAFQAQDAAAIEPLGVEGGQMFYTDVTLAVHQTLFGTAQERIQLRLAGGHDEKVQMVVDGIPELERDQRYILFLRPGYEKSAAPITGVDQGLFRLVKNASTGQEEVQVYDGDIVVAVEKDQLVVVRNPAKAAASRLQLGTAPKPDSKDVPYAELSPEVLRYWRSTEPPMAIDDFIMAVMAEKGVVQ
ncbi:hypothetical protein CKO23_10225 [Thiocystis violacea]|nr:hypothetical protein [Thiocystis violacea]